MRTVVTAALLFLTATTVVAQQGGPRAVTVRLVVAENKQGAKEDAALADVLPLLKENLRFTSYRLLSTHQLQAREKAQANLGKQLSLTLTDVAGTTFMARVKRGAKVVVQTRLNLVPGKPVLVGGLPGEGDSRLIVILHTPK